MYWIKTPWWLPRLFSRKLVWKVRQDGPPAVYITFDDGPHVTATPFVINQLAAYNAKATFFCIGKNVVAYPDIYRQLQVAGHATGNHTQHHLNGWETATDAYINDIIEAHKHIGSQLFRPPYGRIKRMQARLLQNSKKPFKICMWDVLSADFDTRITPEKCLENVLMNIEPGSIIVFHDSDKAWERMSYALPRVLQFCKEKGWECRAIER